MKTWTTCVAMISLLTMSTSLARARPARKRSSAPRAVVPASEPATVTSTVGLDAWIAREVAGRGRLPALAEVLRAAEAELAVPSPRRSRHWRRYARWRAWVPDLDARLGTDRSLDVRDATTTSYVRTGEGFGVQVRLRWSLADVVFNDSVLRVDKALRDRGAARWRAQDRLVELYFERLDVELRLHRRPSLALRLKAARLDGLIEAVTGGRVRSGRRAHNPWPGAR